MVTILVYKGYTISKRWSNLFTVKNGSIKWYALGMKIIISLVKKTVISLSKKNGYIFG